MTAALHLAPVPGLPMIQAGDDLAVLVANAVDRAGLKLEGGDVVCVAQKIVSKAEGRQVDLDDVNPSAQAISLGAETDKDPRLVQLILDESTEVLRQRPGILIVRHRLGLVCANAGIDQSNIDHGGGEQALLLPVDPDRSAAALRSRLAELTGVNAGVLITDSHNRPWRLGTVGVAIGAAGIEVLDDHRGGADLFGRELKVTLINRADAIAAAATLLMGETTERVPLVLAKGLTWRSPRPTSERSPGKKVDSAGNTDPRSRKSATQCSRETASKIVRPLDEDLFR